jgi:hypothetical protein
LWVSSALGTGYSYAGIDVRSSSVTGFGTGSVRDYDSFNYAITNIGVQAESLGTGDGLTANFTGTLTYGPIVDGSLDIKVGETELTDAEASDSGGTISGTSISVGTIDYTTKAYDITFSGTVGTVSAYTGTVDLAGTPLDVRTVANGGVLTKALAFNLNIDGTLYENIEIDSTNATLDNADLVSIINTAIGETVAAVDAGSGNVTISGLIGDATYGKVEITDPTDNVTYDSGVADLFNAAFRFYEDSDRDEKITFDRDNTVSRFRRGTMFTLDVTYNF